MRSLPLQTLSAHHPGLTPSIAGTYVEAASVCFSRHHTPPIELSLEDVGNSSCDVDWPQLDAKTLRAWSNEIDTTEAGAYGVCLAAVELERGLVAIARAETRTGADYYVAQAGHSGEDLEDAFRLEVSGLDRGTSLAVRQRLNNKVRQAAAGESNLPALAVVVGFAAQLVIISNVEKAL
jgi:hypothetical protein